MMYIQFMSKSILFIASIFFLSTSLFASENNPPQINDSIRLDEVIVTGTMPKVNLRNVPMSISIVGERQIQTRLEPSLLPLLTEEVPGLFLAQRGVMGYGVANGAAGGQTVGHFHMHVVPRHEDDGISFTWPRQEPGPAGPSCSR